MRLVFFGSPEFALPSLEALLAGGQDVAAVVTQPDRPSGRGHATTPPPVKQAALGHGIEVLQPENVNDPVVVEQLRDFEADAFIVAAYGQILRQRVLDVPRRGCLNVHASLLPRHRGASPIAAAIIAGDAVTGVTIMELVRVLDAGPMLVQAEEPISDFDTTGTLEPRLARLGAALLAENLEVWASGEFEPRPQDDSQATYAPQIKRADAQLDWSMSAVELWRRVRAFNPWPVAYTHLGGEELRILEAWPLPGDGAAAPGTALAPRPLPGAAGEPREETFAVKAGDGVLAIRRLQRPGRRAISGAEFLRGRRDLVGTVLG